MAPQTHIKLNYRLPDGQDYAVITFKPEFVSPEEAADLLREGPAKEVIARQGHSGAEYLGFEVLEVVRWEETESGMVPIFA
jgi:hypothetical protein